MRQAKKLEHDLFNHRAGFPYPKETTGKRNGNIRVFALSFFLSLDRSVL